MMRAERCHRSRGFSLIEALIALLVLSIGMLGAAAIQLNALQGAHIAYQRSIATLAAQDAQERLWAQMAKGGGCPDWSDARELNELDWNDAWSGYLPGFADASSVDPETSGSNADCKFTITISWAEARSADENPEFTYHVRLPQ